MVRLSRTVRFCINPGADKSGDLVSGRHNTFAAWPSWRGLARYFEITVDCLGDVNPRTGYLFNIRQIDEAVRQYAIPHILRACQGDEEQAPWTLIGTIRDALNEALGGVVDGVWWQLTPFLSVSLKGGTMSECVISQQFCFAASHRLNCASLSNAENEALFGKCNRASGHGHNYRVEVSVVANADGTARPMDISELERLVNATIIERYDHRHLNEDCPEFADRNPSVENITISCHDLLEPVLAGAGIALRRVKVWETDKTSATYPA